MQRRGLRFHFSEKELSQKGKTTYRESWGKIEEENTEGCWEKKDESMVGNNEETGFKKRENKK